MGGREEGGRKGENGDGKPGDWRNTLRLEFGNQIQKTEIFRSPVSGFLPPLICLGRQAR